MESRYINMEISLDGKIFNRVENIKIIDRKAFFELISLFINQLQSIEIKQAILCKEYKGLYLRFIRTDKRPSRIASLENYKNFKHLTNKETAALCYIFQGFRQLQISNLLKVSLNMVQ